MRLLFLAVLINVAAHAQNVGDIVFDPKTDDPKFQLCNPDNIWQSYYLKSVQDETSIMVRKAFATRYTYNEVWANDSGIIRIRFVVNCSGIADRFRLLELDQHLKPGHFTNALKTHLMTITKSIQWPTRRAREQTVDYYHHFSVRIDGGKIEIVQ